MSAAHRWAYEPLWVDTCFHTRPNRNVPQFRLARKATLGAGGRASCHHVAVFARLERQILSMVGRLLCAEMGVTLRLANLFNTPSWELAA
jgi:hypothetical protein